MSASKGIVAALAAAVLGGALLLSWAPRIPDIDVRNQPWRTHSGTIARTAPVGEAFTCERDGLYRIDVCVAASGGALELVLRTDATGGAVVRRAHSGTLSNGPGYARFEFEPIADSAGKRYAFEVAPPEGADGSTTAFVAYRGFGEDVRSWGDHVATTSELEGEFTCEHPNLRGVAIAFRSLAPTSRSAKIELWTEDALGQQPTRIAETKPRTPITNGWAFFSFPVLADSRWKKLRYRLTVPSGAEAIATAQGLSIVSYHGGGQVSPRLGGMLVAGEPASDRDLVFRAWSASRSSNLFHIASERAGNRIWIAYAVWIASVGALVVALLRTSRRTM